GIDLRGPEHGGDGVREQRQNLQRIHVVSWRVAWNSVSPAATSGQARRRFIWETAVGWTCSRSPVCSSGAPAAARSWLAARRWRRRRRGRAAGLRSRRRGRGRSGRRGRGASGGWPGGGRRGGRVAGRRGARGGGGGSRRRPPAGRRRCWISSHLQFMAYYVI